MQCLLFKKEWHILERDEHFVSLRILFMIVVDISGLDYQAGLDLLTSYIKEREEIKIHIDF